MTTQPLSPTVHNLFPLQSKKMERLWNQFVKLTGRNDLRDYLDLAKNDFFNKRILLAIVGSNENMALPFPLPQSYYQLKTWDGRHQLILKINELGLTNFAVEMLSAIRSHKFNYHFDIRMKTCCNLLLIELLPYLNAEFARKAISAIELYCEDARGIEEPASGFFAYVSLHPELNMMYKMEFLDRIADWILHSRKTMENRSPDRQFIELLLVTLECLRTKTISWDEIFDYNNHNQDYPDYILGKQLESKNVPFNPRYSHSVYQFLLKLFEKLCLRKVIYKRWKDSGNTIDAAIRLCCATKNPSLINRVVKFYFSGSLEDILEFISPKTFSYIMSQKLVDKSVQKIVLGVKEKQKIQLKNNTRIKKDQQKNDEQTVSQKKKQFTFVLDQFAKA